jgi:transcriptional regulator with XRE-family HTH domain
MSSSNIQKTDKIKRFIPFGVRLKEIRVSLGITQIEFSEVLNIKQNYLSRYENGEHEFTDDLKLKLVNNILQKYQKRVNLDWLVSGNGEMFLQKQGKSLEKSSATGQVYKIPLLHQKVSCGEGANWEEEQNIKGYIDVFSLIPRFKLGRLFAFSAQGNSMVGAGIKNGDYVLFDTSQDQHLKDDIYVFSLDGEVFCKLLEFDIISKKVKVYSVRVADLEKAELLTTLDVEEADFANRFHIFGRVDSWVHPNFDE